MSTTTDEIKARIDLVELVGRSVALRKSGASYRGLCPFHQEKTPSFYVFPGSHTWVCFGCGKKGTAFDWLMEREHLEFGEALRTLAQVAGVELPSQRDPQQEETSSRLYDALARAQVYYHGLLTGAAGGRGRAYLVGRGVTDETISGFGLGYAPTGNGLLRYLGEAGFTDDELVAAGLGSVSDDGRHFDFLRDRVLFPIRDSRGRTIAFGGRALDNEHQPKYLNSRDTLLFHKQETLFAIDLARKPMAQEHRAVVVEGYMDAVIAHQHGFRNVVATLGTAVTERHLRLLSRLVDDIVMALDSDAAGQAATWRALQVADESLRTGVTPVVGPNRRHQRYVADRAVRLRILTLPGAKDPDELIRADPAQWPRLVQEATSVIDFVLARLRDRHDLSTAEGKAAAGDEIGEVLAGIADPIEQSHYVQEVASLLRVSEDAVRRLLKRKNSGQRVGLSGREVRSEAARGTSAEDRVESSPLDEYALALVAHGRLRGGAAAGPAGPTWTLNQDELALPQHRALLRYLIAEGARLDDVRRQVAPALAPYLAMVEWQLVGIDRLSPDAIAKELTKVQLRLRRRALLARKALITTLLRDGDSDEQRPVLEQGLNAAVVQLQTAEDDLHREEQWLVRSPAS